MFHVCVCVSVSVIICSCSAGYRTMDGLLQRMFETEMDLGTDDLEEEATENRTFSNPVFTSS